MIVLLIVIACYLALFIGLIAFAKPVMIQGNPNPTYSKVFSLRNLGHKALYALAGIVELAAIALPVYGVIYDFAWFDSQNKLNLIWEIILGVIIVYIIYNFHTTIYDLIDKLFGNG